MKNFLYLWYWLRTWAFQSQTLGLTLHPPPWQVITKITKLPCQLMSNHRKRTSLAISSKEGLNAGLYGWAEEAEVKRGLLPPVHKLLSLQASNPEPQPIPQPLPLMWLNCVATWSRNPEASTHPGAYHTSPIWLEPAVTCLKFPTPATTSIREPKWLLLPPLVAFSTSLW